MTEFDHSSARRNHSSAGRNELSKLAFIDLEASGLAPGSWPIEVGVAKVRQDDQITSRSSLIRPEPHWPEDLWSSQSAEIHRISRQVLDDAPAAPDVARWFLKQLDGRIAVSDAPSYDSRWLRMLLLTIEPEPVVRIVDFDQLVAVTYDYQGVQRVYRALDAIPTPHRAVPDAARLARAFVAGAGT